jgi:hypothetical protein
MKASIFTFAYAIGLLVFQPAFAAPTHIAKTCPNCKCNWIDATGNDSATPVPRLFDRVRDKGKPEDKTNHANFYYPVKSDATMPCPPKGRAKECGCRILIHSTWTEANGTQHEDDVVVHAGTDGLRQSQVDDREMRLRNTYHKAPLLTLTPICALLDANGEPEYGEPHR